MASTAQQGSTPAQTTQQQGSQPAKPQPQQGGPIIKDWASI
jgi:hypothetical protein